MCALWKVGWVLGCAGVVLSYVGVMGDFVAVALGSEAVLGGTLGVV